MEAVFRGGEIPADWAESFILNIYKGTCGGRDNGNYHSLKLRDQVMKLLEWMPNFYIYKMVNIDQMQCSCVPSRGTTDTIIVYQLQYISTNKLLYFAFVDLDKAFNRVPMVGFEVPGCRGRSCACHKGMYLSAQCHVRVNWECLGVHPGSVLDSLLFILVMEAPSLEFCSGVPWKHLCAGDLVLITDTLEECICSPKAWKAGMENNGLSAIKNKTKFLVSSIGLDVIDKSGKHLCVVCGSGVSNKSIECS